MTGPLDLGKPIGSTEALGHESPPRDTHPAQPIGLHSETQTHAQLSAASPSTHTNPDPVLDASAPVSSAANSNNGQSTADVITTQVMHENMTINSGIPFPTSIGNVGTVPGVQLDTSSNSIPTLHDKEADGVHAIGTPKSATGTGRHADVDALPAHFNEKRSNSVSSSNSNSKGTDDEKSSSKPKKKGLFSKSKKDKDTQDKKKKEKEEEANAIPPVSFFALFRFATPLEKILNIIGLVFAAAAGAAQPLMTLIFGRLTDSFTDYGIKVQNIIQNGYTPAAAQALEEAKAQLKTDSGRNALYLMAIGIGMFVTIWGFMFIWNWTGEVNAKRLRESYLRAVLRQDIAYFDDLGAGEVATRIQNDCHLVHDGTSERVALVFQYLGTFFTGFALAYARSWRLALALSSILPVIMCAGGVLFVVMTKISTRSLEYVAKSGTLAEEVIGSIRTIQAFGNSATLGRKFSDFIAISTRIQSKGSIFEGGGLATMFFSIYAAYALAFYFGGVLVTQGHASAGVVVNVFFSILIGSFSLAMLAPEMQAISKARGAAAKLFATIDRVPAIDSASPLGDKPDVVFGRLEFHDVKFHYPSRPGVPILKGLSTVFEAGNTVALVGASGSGKSTVIALLERFYDPISGHITLDGREIKSLNLKWLRQQIGLVSQEPTLFATSVRGNVEHGLIGSRYEHASDAEKFELVQKACIDANAHDFIMKLPNGYDTNVGERGMLLSGGQKQRVAIARAIVSDPRILLLDEATSALDTQSEGIVQDALDKAAKGRTTITIAHRLSTIRDADKILVMGGGEILEQGTHNSLLANEQGAYFQLVSNQKLSQIATESPLKELSEAEAFHPGGGPPSPLDDQFPGLARATTGRSLASAVMDDMKARREEEEAEADKVQGQFGLYKRLIKMNSDQKRLYIVGFIAAVCSGMVYPCIAILFGHALQDFQILDPQLLKTKLARWALYFFIVAIIAGFAILIQSFAFSRAGVALNSKLRTRAFSAIMRHDIEWFDEEKNSTGAVTSNLAEDPQKVQGLFGPTMGTVIQSVATLVGGCIIGLSYGPLLALIGIACIPLLVSGGYIRLKVVVLKDQKMKKLHSKSAHMASEAAGAVRTVASLTREDDVDRIYSHALEEPLRQSFQGGLKSQALYAASQGVAFLIIALVFYVGSLWLISNKYQTSQFFTVLTSVVFAALQAGNVFNFVPDASKAGSSAQALFRLFDDVPEVDADSTEGIKLDPKVVEGHVRIEGVHFRYPSRPGVRVLRDLTLDVPPGTYVALVGPSGCGKSTTIQLLERFYDPLIGRVTIDGQDIRDLNVSSYRSSMSLVSQEPTLYAGSVRFNVLLGANRPMEDISEEEVIQACKDANIYDFIMSLPDGFDTEVGGKGSQLSGGQKQRIAIARALIRNPKILLLDEATSALDSQSERVVQDALDRAAKGRTTIAIAHRLSTIQKADIIYCFSEGRVAEKGTHSELLAKRGAYFDLVQMQNLSKV